MSTFSFIELYVDNTNATRTIFIRGAVNRRRSLRHLDRWMGKVPGRAIAAIYETSKVSKEEALEWYSEIRG